ncbi:MAG: hypothetical protein EP329_05840 [Deltaproteobacteria bacterium]|nr:MAG: hypothetical protein EP329_05840 [Deltaproteobacteria bacterium]
MVEPELGDAPIAGASIYFGLPGGELAQAVTDGDGLASFDEPQGWPDAAISLHWYHPQYVYEGRIGITGADLGANGDEAAIKLPTTRLAGPFESDITFNGTLTGYESIDNVFTVSTDTGRMEYQGEGVDTFAVEVPPNTPFQWVAIEQELIAEPGDGIERGYEWKLHHTAMGESDGAAVDFTGAIDLAGTSATLSRAEIAVPMVPDHPSGLATAGFVLGYVGLGPPSGWRPWYNSPFMALPLAGHSERLGVAPGEDVASGGIAWVEPDLSADIRTVFMWWRPDADPLLSLVALPGYPVSGTQDVDFLKPAMILSALWRWEELRNWRNDEPTAWSVVTLGMRTGSGEEPGIKARLVVPPGVAEIDLGSLPPVWIFAGERGFYVLQVDCGDGSYDVGCTWQRHSLSQLFYIREPL